MRNLMEKLPVVISCCFCCFLRAGSVMIAVFSFTVGLLFALNVSSISGRWDLNYPSNHNYVTESTIQLILGIASILLSCVSVLLMVGACCNIPQLILVYQWGAVFYSTTIAILFFILSMFCFFVQANCYIAGILLCCMIFGICICTIYFLIVTNSLRKSIEFMSNNNLVI